MKEKKLKLPKLAAKKHRSKAFKEPGLFWHFHHATLVELCQQPARRIEEIYNCKDREEHALRFKLINRVKLATLPKEVKKWIDDYTKAYKAWVLRGNDRTYERMDRARGKVNGWIYDNKEFMSELHDEQCKGCTWDGRTIFTGKYAHLDPY